jgi:4,5-dihydroxyphthalate decarboxylase
MHTIVLRKDVYEKHPWAAASLFEAFEQAKAWAYDQLMETDALKLTLPWVVAETEETRRIMGEDFWPYGVDANRRALAALPQYLYEQHLAPRIVPIEELFVDPRC